MRTRLMRRLISLGDKMNWKDTLKKKLVGGQKKLDKDKDGDIDADDFRQLREEKEKLEEELEKE